MTKISMFLLFFLSFMYKNERKSRTKETILEGFRKPETRLEGNEINL